MNKHKHIINNIYFVKKHNTVFVFKNNVLKSKLEIIASFQSDMSDDDILKYIKDNISFI